MLSFVLLVMLASATFDRFTIKYALKMIATSGFFTALECTKFVFVRGFAPYPAGVAYSAPPDP